MADVEETGGSGPARPQTAALPTEQSSGVRKAALFLAQMSPEEAGKVLAQLRPREIESLTRALMRLGAVEVAEVDDVMTELHGPLRGGQLYGQGGEEFAREILAAGLGEDKAEALLARLT